MLTQFKTAFKLVEPEFRTVDDFVKKYKVFYLFQINLLKSRVLIRRFKLKLECPLALFRIKEDRPITIKDDKGNSSKSIAQTVSVGYSILFNPVPSKAYNILCFW